jgi:predicted metalloprotease with PDZ domain
MRSGPPERTANDTRRHDNLPGRTFSSPEIRPYVDPTSNQKQLDATPASGEKALRPGFILLILLVALACTTPSPPVTVAPPEAPLPALQGAVRATLRLPAPQTNRVEVELTAETRGEAAVTFRMPVWTPGSYLVRDFSRHVETLAAFGPDGAPLAVEKSTKNRWVVQTAGVASVTLRYTVYCREMSVRSGFVDRDIAIFAPAAVFVEPLHLPGVPYDVKLERPAAWTGVETGLDPHPSGEIDRWVARDWDELVDSPIVGGTPTTVPFEVQGVPHRFAHFGGDGWWDVAKAAEDTKKIVEAEAAVWGVIPYDHYVFLNIAGEAGGGLEHLDSTVMLTTRNRGRDPAEYDKWLGLVSHELFHAWNVKRLHPRPLGPFDYDQENYTTSLWISEGFTAYYDDLVLVRAGLIKPSDHLSRLSGVIAALQQRPGHLVQSLDESSFDTWIKHYRPDENADNRQVDYYVKGSLTAWLLDAAIREATQDRRSLDDVMRLAWERFPPERGFDEPEFKALFSEVAGTDLSAMVDALVLGRDEVDYTPALAWWGLRFVAPEEPDDRHKPKVWTGLDAAATVTRVLRGTPAFDAGVNVGDELIGLDGVRINGGDTAPMLVQREPGETAQLLVSRRGTLLTLPVTLAAAPVDTWKLEFDPDAPAAAAARRKAWWQAEEPAEP